MGFNLFFYLIIFVFGLAVGSFLNCVIYRLERGENFLTGRSYCPHCKHQLNWQDLIPIFSFIFLKGKCRYCYQKISWQYPLVELSTGILFLLIFSQLEIIAMAIISSFYWVVIICFLIVIFVYDLKYYIIPDKVIYPAIIISFLFQLFSNPSFFINPLLSAFLAALPFLLIVWFSQGKWMGGGDIKLAFFMGLFLGFPNILPAFFISFFLGAIIGIGLIIAGKKTLKSEIPFGPFLIAGTFIALFLGEKIINWYLNLFL